MGGESRALFPLRYVCVYPVRLETTVCQQRATPRDVTRLPTGGTVHLGDHADIDALFGTHPLMITPKPTIPTILHLPPERAHNAMNSPNKIPQHRGQLQYEYVWRDISPRTRAEIKVPQWHCIHFWIVFSRPLKCEKCTVLVITRSAR